MKLERSRRLMTQASSQSSVGMGHLANRIGEIYYRRRLGGTANLARTVTHLPRTLELVLNLRNVVRSGHKLRPEFDKTSVDTLRSLVRERRRMIHHNLVRQLEEALNSSNSKLP